MDKQFYEAPYAYGAHMGWDMVEWSDGFARFEMPVRSFHLNRHDNLHGGTHASLLDTVMGYAGCWTGVPDQRQMCLTLSLNVQFVSRSDRPLLIAEGRKTDGGASIFFAEGYVRDDQGLVLARATGVFKYRRRQTD
ncbi:MAG: PaaI family thioesterase [Pseudoprimorskyibacter sp.]|nr:PaaI family thioesterase [Pseudoprimorskyibacter sp.]